MITSSHPIGQENTHARNTIEAMIAAPRWLMSREKKPYYRDGNMRNGELDTPNDIAKLVTYSEIRETIDNSGGQFELGFALGPMGTVAFGKASI
jgi:hypothetical protein